MVNKYKQKYFDLKALVEDYVTKKINTSTFVDRLYEVYEQKPNDNDIKLKEV